MDRIAVFVDSGYLFAQGSAALSGSKQKRSSLLLDHAIAVEKIKSLATAKASECKLLRIYWYDGALGGLRPTADQALLAEMDDVKLRLGFVNSSGQQKGVDSLIVTDLIELARLQSISDALLISGDEDVRIGVQIAQNYGVRIHLIGIEPARASQSIQLMQEADTTSELTKADLAEFLRIKPELLHSVSPAELESVPDGLTRQMALVEAVAGQYVREMSVGEIAAVEAYWKTSRGVPSEHDGKLLAVCRDKLGRNLDRQEIKVMRAIFQKLASRRSAE